MDFYPPVLPGQKSTYTRVQNTGASSAYVIRVQTLDRVVFLDGVVSSGLEIDAAESIARDVPGVARVVNSIVVSTAR